MSETVTTVTLLPGQTKIDKFKTQSEYNFPIDITKNIHELLGNIIKAFGEDEVYAAAVDNNLKVVFNGANSATKLNTLLSIINDFIL